MTVCLGCKKEFEERRWWQKYCSPKCRRVVWIRKHPVMVSCPKCGADLKEVGNVANR